MDFRFLEGESYEFLRTNPYLQDNIMFLCLGGSKAYGTCTPSSDTDVRGCYFNTREQLFGFDAEEQVVNTDTDTTVYSFKKLLSMLMECNPNTIEMLGCKPEHYAAMTPAGRTLIENRHIFLSHKAAASFMGYANQQLRRLENALANGYYPQAEKEVHIQGTLESAMRFFYKRYPHFKEGDITLAVVDSEISGEKKIIVNMNICDYPLREMVAINNDMLAIVKTFDKLTKRNNKKDEAHLNKHAMHLIRLFLMGIDIFEKEEIITYRENDLAFLMSIRNGKFQKTDGTYRHEFFEMVNDYEKRMKYAIANSSLPEKPNRKQIEDFSIEINMSHI